MYLSIYLSKSLHVYTSICAGVHVDQVAVLAHPLMNEWNSVAALGTGEMVICTPPKCVDYLYICISKCIYTYIFSYSYTHIYIYIYK